mmetsp:Transcript_28149/g.50310  ORF Transcript_28149/g.50310 Transcript_28149/m.50310 type:complete len:303 (+) Transcript_28149:630-1538(+)
MHVVVGPRSLAGRALQAKFRVAVVSMAGIGSVLRRSQSPHEPHPPLGRGLWEPLLGLVVHVGDPETLAVAISPLEVVKQSPRKVACDRSAGELHSQGHLVQVSSEIVYSELIIQGFSHWHFIFAWHVHAVLCDDDSSRVVLGGHILQVGPQCPGHDQEPLRVGLRSDWLSICSVALLPALFRGLARIDVLASVGVQPVKVKGTSHQGRLLGCEAREQISETLAHGGRIVPGEVDGIRKPTYVEVVVELCRLNVCRAGGVLWKAKIRVEDNGDYPAGCFLVLLAVDLHSARVRQQGVMCTSQI